MERSELLIRLLSRPKGCLFGEMQGLENAAKWVDYSINKKKHMLIGSINIMTFCDALLLVTSLSSRRCEWAVAKSVASFVLARGQRHANTRLLE